MSDDDLAHSASKEYGIPAQSYCSHSIGVYGGACRNACILSRLCPSQSGLFQNTLPVGSEYHDLGKIHKPNREALFSNTKLPINHTDAGVAFLKDKNLLAAILILSHHRGLPNFQEIAAKPHEQQFRDLEIKDLVDSEMSYLLERHRRQFGESEPPKIFIPEKAPSPLTYRMLLSGLVDADWSDTSYNYHNIVPLDDIALKPVERLKHLDDYVKGLESKATKRNQLRHEAYQKCHDCVKRDEMLLCELPVGVGKTTAVMAKALQIAILEKRERIFVIAPYTALIDQIVEVLRSALVLYGEDPKKIVAAHHHRVDYGTESCRQYAATWSSPVVVTTAVQFFETLAGNHPAALRKLHHVAGSVLCVDEFHAALPSHLLQIVWGWLKELTEKWSCNILFSSGSPIRFWEMEEFAGDPEKVKSIISSTLFKKALKKEKARVKIKFWKKRHTLASLYKWTQKSKGPRVIVFSTQQSDASFARYLTRKVGDAKVECLSNSMTPMHRRESLAKIRERLNNKKDTDWTLVATSCAESGLHLSFRNGFIEERSMSSVLQLVGRISREAEYKDSVLHVFCLRYNDYLKEHPAFKTAIKVLREMFKVGKVSPEYCTEAFKREIRRRTSSDAMKQLAKAEAAWQFEDVRKHFQIIAAGTETVVLPEIAERLRRGEKVDWWDIQDNSVQIWKDKAEQWGVAPIFGFDEIKEWTLAYDKKLGIMAGVLPLVDAKKSKIFII